MEYLCNYKFYLKGLKGSLERFKEAKKDGNIKLSAKEDFDCKFKQELAKIVTSKKENLVTSKLKYAMNNKKVLARFYARSFINLISIADEYNRSKVFKYFKNTLKLALSDYVCHEKFSLDMAEVNNTYKIRVMKGFEVFYEYTISDANSLVDSATSFVGLLGSYDEGNSDLEAYLRYYLVMEANVIKNHRQAEPYIERGNKVSNLESFIEKDVKPYKPSSTANILKMAK